MATMSQILSAYQFTAEQFIEDDSTITLSLDQIDLVENGKTESEVKEKLAQAIMEYAVDYYENYSLYSIAPNRKEHIPYIFKALITDDIGELGESIICHAGKS